MTAGQEIADQFNTIIDMVNDHSDILEHFNMRINVLSQCIADLCDIDNERDEAVQETIRNMQATAVVQQDIISTLKSRIDSLEKAKNNPWMIPVIR